MEEALKSIIDRGLTVAAAAERYNVGYFNLRRNYRILRDKHDRGDTSSDQIKLEKKKRGRKRSLEDAYISELKEELTKEDRSCNSLSPKEIGVRIHEKRKQQALNEGRNALAIKPVGISTERRLIKEIAPELIAKAQIKNNRRYQAIRDMYGAISHAVISHAILQPSLDKPFGRIKHCFMFNVDAVSCVIGESTSAKVRLVRGSNEYLKQVNRSPSKTVKQEKRRAVKQLYVTSADGYLNCAIIVLKDSHIKELKLIPIDKHHSGGYQLWLLLVPYQPKKRKNTQTVQNENATANNTISSSSVDDQQEATIENQVEEDCDLFSLLLEEEADHHDGSTIKKISCELFFIFGVTSLGSRASALIRTIVLA
eukprot:scaffold7106_cov217-Ochromonas_danica.AAC.1